MTNIKKAEFNVVFLKNTHRKIESTVRLSVYAFKRMRACLSCASTNLLDFFVNWLYSFIQSWKLNYCSAFFDTSLFVLFVSKGANMFHRMKNENTRENTSEREIGRRSSCDVIQIMQVFENFHAHQITCYAMQ